MYSKTQIMFFSIERYRNSLNKQHKSAFREKPIITVVKTIQIQMQKLNRHPASAVHNSHPFLHYFSKFPAIPNQPNTMEQFSDGVFLIEFSRLIEGFRIEGEIIDAPRTLQQRYANLKTLFRSIENFWSRTLGAQIEGEEVRLVEVARNGNPQQVIRLLQLMVKTAVQADNKRDFIEPVLLTSPQTQQFLKKIIEPLQTTIRESPRKQKEKRMLDKIFELHHENADLQAVLKEVCEQKLELEMKVRVLQAKLSESARQKEQLQFMLRQDAFTPQKKRSFGIPDTSDRKDSLIEALKTQLHEITANNQRELQVALNAVERARIQCSQFDQMRDQLALNREIIASHKEFRAEAQIIQQELSQARAEIMNKDNHIACLRQQLDKSAKNTLDLENSLTAYKAELQRKHIQITQLIGKVQQIQRRSSPRKDSYGNLLFDLPSLVNTETQAYIQTNRSLREELERSRLKLEQSQLQLAQHAAELQLLRACGAQNNKLRQMVLELNADRGQENEILVSSLYHLRKMIQGQRF